MTGVTGSVLVGMEVGDVAAMESYEMACRQMPITRTPGPLNLKGRDPIRVSFVELPLSDGGLRATHTFEALPNRGPI
jgi:hypothetical protein